MRIHGTITMNGKTYEKGDEIPWYKVYPFFLVHMLMFGASGFFMAYAEDRPEVMFLYLHGGIAIFAYVSFYLVMFGIDEVKWMFINAGLGLLGIYAQIGWILALFGKKLDDFPLYTHVVPFLYYILYTFLLHQMVLDVTEAREREDRRKIVNVLYVIGSTAFYGLAIFIQ